MSIVTHAFVGLDDRGCTIEIVSDTPGQWHYVDGVIASMERHGLLVIRVPIEEANRRMQRCMRRCCCPTLDGDSDVQNLPNPCETVAP